MGWMVPLMAAAQQRQTEERLLAELIAKDEKNEYEYKILHAYSGAFRRAERLQEILDEERQARWELVMKLDDTRIILRRPRHAQVYGTGAGVDPYRTQIGSNRVAAVLIVAGLLGLMVAAMVALGEGAGRVAAGSWPIVLTLIATVILVLLLVMIKRAR